MKRSPILRQSAGAGDGEDSLAEALENTRHPNQALPRCIYPRQQCLDFCDNTFLFGERRQGDFNLLEE